MLRAVLIFILFWVGFQSDWPFSEDRSKAVYISLLQVMVCLIWTVYSLLLFVVFIFAVLAGYRAAQAGQSFLFFLGLAVAVFLFWGYFLYQAQHFWRKWLRMRSASCD